MTHQFLVTHEFRSYAHSQAEETWLSCYLAGQNPAFRLLAHASKQHTGE